MATITKNLGPATAYGYAKEQGYTGTEEQYAELMASYATVAEQAAASASAAAGSADTASTKATAAANSATAASNSATTATTKADEAATSATNAANSANTANTKAGEAASSATAASGSASTASTKAGEASASATAAAGSATDANTAKVEAQAAQTAAEAAQTAAEEAAETAQGTLESYAKVDGSYASMTVGNAEQLVSTVGIEDSVPYNFRTAGGSADIGDRETDMVVGGTVAWNQFARELDGTYWQSANATESFSNGVVSFTASARYGCVLTKVAHKVPAVNGHKYFLSGKIKPASTSNVRFGMGVASNFGNTGVAKATITGDGSTFQNIDIIGNFTGDNTANNCVIIMESATGDFAEIQAKDIVLFDLTQMFGSTIADYIYSLEQANAGAGVAWFRKLFPKPYYAYNAGELMSVQTSAHKMVGFNQLKSAENSASATPYDNALFGQVKLLPNTTYCLSFVAAVGHKFYTNEKLWTNRMVTGTGERQYVIATTVAELSEDDATQYDANYGWRLCKNYVGNTVLPNFTDVCINLSWDGEKDGTYEPYELHSYALDSSLTLRGIPKLDSDNKLYYDGDTYESDGKVTRKYGIVDLGTLGWNKHSRNVFYTYGFTAKPVSASNVVSNLICSEYKTLSGDAVYSYKDGISMWSTSGNVAIYDSNKTDLTANQFKTAMSGVMLVYELATPTTESADPYQNPQIVNDFGTEEYVDAGVTAATPTRDVAIPVGHSTFYAANLRAKLEMAPDSPEGNGDYIVRQTDGENSYVPLVIPTELPANPSTDGTYSLKVTVSDGTATLSWVADS